MSILRHGYTRGYGSACVSERKAARIDLPCAAGRIKSGGPKEKWYNASSVVDPLRCQTLWRFSESLCTEVTRAGSL
jgi:hypothetical protein